MNYNLKKLSEVNVLTKVELQKVLAGTQPDCEDGFAIDEDGVCRAKVEQGGGYDNSTGRCDRA
ncbi:MAG: hypothetical protein JXR05_05900 [Flavobacteriaceae bacterium]